MGSWLCIYVFIAVVSQDRIAVVGCSLTSLAGGNGSAASYLVFGENGPMVPPLRAGYTAWALGPACSPSSH